MTSGNAITNDDLMTETELRQAIGGSEDPAEIALDQLESTLLARIPDAVDRWRATQEVARGAGPALEHVRALCVAQLIAEGSSVAEAAERLHVSRQRANILLTEHEQPTPRKLRTNPIHDEIGYRYGVYLGVASAIAERVDARRPDTRATTQIDKIHSMAEGTPANIVRQVREMVAAWTKRGFAGDTNMHALKRELEEATAQLGDLPTRLPSAQQNHMWIAISSTRVRLRPAK